MRASPVVTRSPRYPGKALSRLLCSMSSRLPLWRCLRIDGKSGRSQLRGRVKLNSASEWDLQDSCLFGLMNWGVNIRPGVLLLY